LTRCSGGSSRSDGGSGAGPVRSASVAGTVAECGRGSWPSVAGGTKGKGPGVVPGPSVLLRVVSGVSHPRRPWPTPPPA
jgi:hypothetical protein